MRLVGGQPGPQPSGTHKLASSQSQPVPWRIPALPRPPIASQLPLPIAQHQCIYYAPTHNQLGTGRWRLLEGPEADAGALSTRAGLLEQRLASKQAELDNKAAMVDLGTQLEQALVMALAEKRPQAQALACQVAACLPCHCLHGPGRGSRCRWPVKESADVLVRPAGVMLARSAVWWWR